MHLIDHCVTQSRFFSLLRYIYPHFQQDGMDIYRAMYANKVMCLYGFARKSDMETEPFRLDRPSVRGAGKKCCEKASIVEYARRDMGGGI